MVFGFIKLLGRWRSLPAELADLERRCIAAEDEARHWRSRAEIWEKEAIKTHEEKDKIFHCFVDWCAMRYSGFPVFGDSPPAPREPSPGDVKPQMPQGKRLARDVVQEITSAYDAELRKFRQSQEVSQ